MEGPPPQIGSASLWNLCQNLLPPFHMGITNEDSSWCVTLTCHFKKWGSTSDWIFNLIVWGLRLWSTETAHCGSWHRYSVSLPLDHQEGFVVGLEIKSLYCCVFIYVYTHVHAHVCMHTQIYNQVTITCNPYFRRKFIFTLGFTCFMGTCNKKL
jgi:hypothetical protein